MKTIYQNAASSLSVVISRDGETIADSGTVTVGVVTISGAQCVASKTAAMTAGTVSVAFSQSETAAVPLGDVMLVVSGGFGVRRFALACESLTRPASSLLFVRDLVIDKLRADRLVLLASSVLPDVKISDDYIWDKVLAAESEISHTLRVPLVPTTFFPDTPTSSQIDALAGAPWGIDPGYDYEPGSFGGSERWGMIKLRNKPLQSVSLVRFAYPGGIDSTYDLPLDWLRMEKKYGIVQFVPSSRAFIAPLNAFVMQTMGSGRTIPLAIQITYVAGIANAKRDYPELIDVILKKVALKIVEDAFMPQSGSISADGLSQSVSVDMDKYHDVIDRALNGGKGANGGLMASIHGVRVGVV